MHLLRGRINGELLPRTCVQRAFARTAAARSHRVPQGRYVLAAGATSPRMPDAERTNGRLTRTHAHAKMEGGVCKSAMNGLQFGDRILGNRGVTVQAVRRQPPRGRTVTEQISGTEQPANSTRSAAVPPDVGEVHARYAAFRLCLLEARESVVAGPSLAPRFRLRVGADSLILDLQRRYLDGLDGQKRSVERLNARSGHAT
jgi:hypothetical protein